MVFFRYCPGVPTGEDMKDFVRKDSRRSSTLSLGSISVGGGALAVVEAEEEKGSSRYKSLWRKAIMEHILNNRLIHQEKMQNPVLPYINPASLHSNNGSRGLALDLWTDFADLFNESLELTPARWFGRCHWEEGRNCSGLLETVRSGEMDASLSPIILNQNRLAKLRFSPLFLRQERGFYMATHHLSHSNSRSTWDHIDSLTLYDWPTMTALLALLLFIVALFPILMGLERWQLLWDLLAVSIFRAPFPAALGFPLSISLLLALLALFCNYQSRFTGNAVSPRVSAPFSTLDELEALLEKGKVHLAVSDSQFVRYMLHRLFLKHKTRLLFGSAEETVAAVCSGRNVIGVGDLSYAAPMYSVPALPCKLHIFGSNLFPLIYSGFIFPARPTLLFHRFRLYLNTVYNPDQIDALAFRRYLFRVRRFGKSIENIVASTRPIESGDVDVVFLLTLMAYALAGIVLFVELGIEGCRRRHNWVIIG